MKFDANNPVVKLCAQGMQVENEGNTADAHKIFTKAWEAATTDFERFTAAHYLARNQPTPELNLHWNLEALRFAQLAGSGELGSHLPSLYLNVGKSYENMGQTNEAINYYQLACDSSAYLPQGNYGDMMRMGISRALARVGITPFSNTTLDDLINKWCETKYLKPLAFVLPAYVGNLGSETDINKLVSSLSYLAASQSLNAEEQKQVEAVIATLSSAKQ